MIRKYTITNCRQPRGTARKSCHMHFLRLFGAFLQHNHLVKIVLVIYFLTKIIILVVLIEFLAPCCSVLEDCHAVGLLCIFLYFIFIMLIGVPISIMQPGLVIEYIIFFILVLQAYKLLG